MYNTLLFLNVSFYNLHQNVTLFSTFETTLLIKSMQCGQQKNVPIAPHLTFQDPDG